jgi:hypothetical protein
VTSGLPGGREQEPEARDEGRGYPALGLPVSRSLLPSLSQRPPGITPAVRRLVCPSRLPVSAGPGVSAAGRALSLECSRTRPWATVQHDLGLTTGTSRAA